MRPRLSSTACASGRESMFKGLTTSIAIIIGGMVGVPMAILAAF
ncbi:hypothetical protein RZ517_08630 [Roseovarius sp. S88]|uniref:Uncharacterized protein n=1 Tax=Roseovarius phycicola TaxID=3080976 RepID=A0ABZ2HKC0_9RHOB